MCMRVVGPAAIVKAAVARLEAVEPDAALRQRSGNRLELLLEQLRHLGLECLHRFGHVLLHQQLTAARMTVLLVEVHDPHGA